MTGDWIGRLARRILRDDTFSLIASPAIADLQFERVANNIVALIGAYAAVWVAIGGGLRRDAALALTDASCAIAPRGEWPIALEGPSIVLVLSMMTMTSGMSSVFMPNGAADYALVGALFLPFGIVTATPFVVFGIGSRLTSIAHRYSLRVTLTVAAVLFAPLAFVSYALLPRADVALADVFLAAQVRQDSASQASLWHVLTNQKADIDEFKLPGSTGDRRRRGPERVAFAASVFAYGVAGLAWAKRRRVQLILGMATLAFAQYLLYASLVLQVPASRSVQMWLGTLLLIAASAAALSMRVVRLKRPSRV